MKNAKSYCAINANQVTRSRRHFGLGVQAGFSLIELMIAVTLSLIITAALIALFLNINRANSEMAKTNMQIENGRFAMQLLQSDIELGGYWGGYIPQFDDLTFTSIPTDTPTAVPNPCLAYTTPWTATDIRNFITIPVQVYGDTPPPGTGCLTNLAINKKAGTDVLVVRYAETCVADSGGNCEDYIPGNLYFQAPLCEDEIFATVQAATATTVTLIPSASTVNDFYKGGTIRIVSGTGTGQSRVISAYDGATRVATLSAAWMATPVNPTSKYAFGDGYVLDTAGFSFHKRNCTTVADKRKFISHIYYIRDYAKTVGDGIPTLMGSQFDLAGGGALAHQEAVPLIEGIEGFRVELGVDSLSDTGAAVNYATAVTWANLANLTSPTNRGDGVPDGAFISCTDAAPCTVAQLSNVVAVKLYVLARADTVSPGYKDTKSYALGSTIVPSFNDGFKRHVFSTTVRLNNVSGRRETPP